MNAQEILTMVKSYLYDKKNVVWSDAELLCMIDDSVRQYSEDSGCFFGRFDIHPNESGKYVYPQDYIYFIAGWNTDECGIVANSSSDMRYFNPIYNITKGKPISIYDDLSNPGEYRLCPDPIDLQTLDYWVMSGTEEYGTIADYGYGVLKSRDRYKKYGTDMYLYDYIDVGDIVYVRYGEVGEITDYRALVYWTLYLAYSEDSDMVNNNQAQMYKEEYRRRVSGWKQIKNAHTGITQHVKFY